ncbi:MAG TPA: hypothetical protein VHW24_05290, partial [Bryobacteraceae bacterium]|nr:hypothetical protein [Bryobacteraceae bacterium]
GRAVRRRVKFLRRLSRRIDGHRILAGLAGAFLGKPAVADDFRDDLFDAASAVNWSPIIWTMVCSV